MRDMLKLTFESDWYMGSGAGIPGSVDRQVTRDADGLPYVPGKTITGLLRDAAEWIADTKDALGVKPSSGEQSWRDVLLSLFGEQPESHGENAKEGAKAAAVGIGSAKLSSGLRQALRKREHLKPFLFIVRPGVTIDPQTGTSLKDHLFSTEKARQGCELYATLKFNRSLSGDEKVLLDDAVKSVRRIGGNRRRGAGKCRLEVTERGGGANGMPNRQTPNLPGKVEDDFSVTLNFRLTTRQPVVVNRVTLGNVVETETIIPGNLLLPYFANDLFHSFDREKMRLAILNGDFSVGDFLPAFGECPSYPIPLSFGSKKSDDNMMMNRLLRHGGEREQIKDLRSGFVTVHLNEKEIRYRSPGYVKTLRAHNTVEDDSQRPTAKVGGFFFYEAIKEEQRFSGTVKIKGSLWNELSDEVKTRLKAGETNIGRSRKDEYGQVSLEFLSSANPTEDTLPLIDAKKGKYLVVYLLSDILIRGEFQEYSTRLDDLRLTLENALGLKLSDVPEEDWHERISPLGGERGHCVRVGRRESWHTRWTLPRPSLVYFQAGSVLLYKVENPDAWDEKTIRGAMNRGIGDRGAEGYGRFWINPPFLCDRDFSVVISVVKPNESKVIEPDDAEDLADVDKKFLARLTTEYHKKRFTQAARRYVYSVLDQLHQQSKTLPTASQFGGLREIAAFIRYEGNDLKLLQDWVRPIDRKTGEAITKKNWDEKWLRWIECWIEDPEDLWKTVTGDNFPQYEGLDMEKMKIFALCTFIDILCEGVFDAKQEERHKEEETV
jgi:CRISPR-associated protein Csx10